MKDDIFKSLDKFLPAWHNHIKSNPVSLRSFYGVIRDCKKSPNNISGIVSNGLSQMTLWGYLNLIQIQELTKFEYPIEKMKKFEPYLLECNHMLESYSVWAIDRLEINHRKWRIDLFESLVNKFISSHLVRMRFDGFMKISKSSSINTMLDFLSLEDTLKAIRTAINSASSLCVYSNLKSEAEKQRIVNWFLDDIISNIISGKLMNIERIRSDVLRDDYSIDIGPEISLEEFWATNIHFTSKELLDVVRYELSLVPKK